MNPIKRHLVIFTTMHPVGDVRVWQKIATSFVSKGWRITWIGPDRTDFPPSTAGDEVTYLLIGTPRSRRGRLKAMPKLLRLLAATSNVDAIYCPEPDSALLALPFAKQKSAKLIFDIHENYHKGALQRWVPPVLATALTAATRILISKVAEKADFSVAVNSDIADVYATQGNRPTVIRNLAPRHFGEAPKTSPKNNSDPENFRVFHGKAAAENGTEVLLKAWALLKGHPRIKLVLIPKLADSQDDLMPALRRTIETLGIAENVELVPPVSHSEMPALLDLMDLGMIAYQRDLGMDSLPNRFFEYMARGLATMTPSYSHYLEEITCSTRCGISVDMESPEHIARSLVQLSETPDQVRSMGERGRNAFLSTFSWEAEFEAFYALVVAEIPGPVV